MKLASLCIGCLTAFIVSCAAPIAAHAEERAIAKQVVVKAPVEAVWNAWTTTEGVKSFFAPDARVEARVDGPFEIYINPYAAPGMKGADDMRFLALQPMKMLSFTWNAPPSLPEARAQRTFVVVRLKPAGEGQTEVSLYHAGWGEGGEWDKAYDYFNRAWGNVLANLEKRFVEGPVDWTQWLSRLKPVEAQPQK